MPSGPNSSASSGRASWLLAAPATMRHRSSGIVSEDRIPPVALGEKTSQAVRNASSAATISAPRASAASPARAGSTSLTSNRAPARPSCRARLRPTEPTPWTSTVRPPRSDAPNAWVTLARIPWNKPIAVGARRHREYGLAAAERKPGNRILGGHGAREPKAVTECLCGLGVGLQPGPAAGRSQPGGVNADEHPRREVTVEADGDLLAVPSLEQFEHRELLRCGGDVDGPAALFLGPLGGPLLLDVLLRLPLLALLAALVLGVHDLPFERGRSNYALREVGEGLTDILSDAGDERDLLLRVPPGGRLAERPDALHDAPQVVRLEGQDPLPVVDAERAGGVGQDVGESTAPLAVLAEQGLAFPGGEQVPLRGPDERIDVQEALRRPPPGEGRRVVRGELGRLHHAHEHPDGVEQPARDRAAELHQCALHVVGTRPDQPQHEVRVGPEPDRRIDAPDRDPALPLLEQVLDLLGGIVGVQVRECRMSLEHRVQGVQRFGHLTCSPSIDRSRPARCVCTASAASFPPRTQSAIPGPRYAGPTRYVPGGRARSMAATRSRCPTSYCGIDRGHRTRRQAAGSAGSGRIAASWRATPSAIASSGWSRMSSVPEQPTKQRTTARSPKARSGHFRETSVHAVMANFPLGTTNPEVSGNGSPVP